MLYDKLTCAATALLLLCIYSTSQYIIDGIPETKIRGSGHKNIHSITTNNIDRHPWLKETDLVYNDKRNTVPVVNDEYKIVFFLTAKVASTEFVRFFARLQSNPNWCKPNIHHPGVHKLKLLNSYSIEEAQQIMTSPEWTKAIFVRHPKSRLLSAYLDKAIHYSKRFVGEYCEAFRRHNKNYDECVEKHEDFDFFLKNITSTLNEDVHWRTIYSRVDEKWWPYMSYVGYMENLNDDVKSLFSSVYSNIDGVSAWDRIGKSGWSGNKNGDCQDNLKSQIPFLGHSDGSHTTRARNKMKEYYTPELEDYVEKHFADDLQNPFFHFDKINLFLEDSNEEEISVRISREIDDNLN